MRELTPEHVLKSVKKGMWSPCYLFYGTEDFWIEHVIENIKKTLVPQPARDFNVEMIYGGQLSAQEIVNRANSLPFMSTQRLIVVRETGKYLKDHLDVFLNYLDNPADTTCIIWISEKADFRIRFYKKFKELGTAIHFKKLSDSQVYGWTKKRARDIALDIDEDACALLCQVVGNNLRDLFNELTKLSLGSSSSRIRVDDVKEMASFGRLFTVFDLVDYAFKREGTAAVRALNRVFDTQGRDSKIALGVLAMLERQIRMIAKIKIVLKQGGGRNQVREKLQPSPDFVIQKCIEQEKLWNERQLEAVLNHIYETDDLIKIGSKPDLMLENLILQLCFSQNPH